MSKVLRFVSILTNSVYGSTGKKDLHKHAKKSADHLSNRKSYLWCVCTIWDYLCNFKNVKNIHGGVLILVKLQASSCNFSKINTPPWVFFTFFKLHKWYQIAQRIFNNYSVTAVNKSSCQVSQVS